jgi:hypothetical protein
VDQLPWRRYWIRRGGTYEAEGGGFLVEPGSIHQLLQARNANLSLLDDLDGVRCVIALGDPGLGKSRELESYAARVHERFRRDALLSFDLKDFDNRDSLLSSVRLIEGRACCSRRSKQLSLRDALADKQPTTN